MVFLNTMIKFHNLNIFDTIGKFKVQRRRLLPLFAGNLHKWTFCPRGCAIMWIRPDYHDVIDPNIISHFQFSEVMQLRLVVGCNWSIMLQDSCIVSVFSSRYVDITFKQPSTMFVIYHMYDMMQ